jgi:hypothetical protein
MERLIMEYSVGDGYTYSSEVTYPIIYKDKPSAINDLELLVLKHLDDMENHTAKLDKLAEKQNNLFKKIQNKENKSKKGEPNDPIWTQLSEINAKIMEQEKLFSNEFIFGGTSLEYSNFYYMPEGTNKYNLSLPTISTLDEFYASAQATLSNNPKKNKM